ncbi:MAG: HD domain-containing phosphohydrolase [Phycisphaerae bacterium]
MTPTPIHPAAASGHDRGGSEDVGCLPEPEVRTPLSSEVFVRLTRCWRGSDVWLSMWSHRGDLVANDSEGPRLWNRLLASGPNFRNALRAIALRAIDDAANGSETLPRPTPNHLGPWQPDLGILAIPVRQRRRVLGVLLAGVVLVDEPDEALERLCGQCEVDRTVTKDLARRIRPIRPEALDGVADLLDLTVDQAREIDKCRYETVDLARNLNNTYEELNLIYRISARMGIPQHPIRMLEQVGRETLPVSRASAIAFVAHDPERFSAAPDAAGVSATEGIDERVVQVGKGAPSLEDVGRLAQALNIETHRDRDYFLINQAAAAEELAWASAWLQHIVAIPLYDDQKFYGALLAINCEDDGDFTSVDVQLLRAVADRVTAFLENQRLYDDLADLLMGLLHALINSIDAKDPYTCGHSERVAYLSRILAQAAGLTPVQCQRVYLAGLLHDVGKIGVPDAILCKPGKLTREEFAELRRHPEIGGRILAEIRQIKDLMPGVLYHHERMDGRGYPRGLVGADIPRLGRIICLADCFDAMTTSRTYRTALPLQLAICEIRRCAGTQFDPHLSELFLSLDLKRAMREAHASASNDRAFSHLGVLSVGSDAWPPSQEPRAESAGRSGGA